MKTKSLEEIKATIKQELIIEQLMLEDISADDIKDDMPLFGDGLGLDSVESFEMIIGIEQIFGVNVEKIAAEELKEHMYSVNALALLLKSEMNKITS